MNRTRVLATLLAAIAFVVVPSHARAQSLTTGELGGVVRSGVGGGLSEVQVTLRGLKGGLPVSVTTDRDGRFLVSLLPAGEYELRAERLGFRPVVLAPIPVRPDRRLDVQVALTRAEGFVEDAEVVAFRGEALTAGSQPAQSRYFGDWELRALPDRGGELTELVGHSSLGGEPFAVEGLPSSLSSFVVGGVPFKPASHRGDRTDEMAGLLLPRIASGGAELLAGQPDLEWPAVAGSLLSTVLRPAPDGFGGEVAGLWSGEALLMDDRPGGEPSVARGSAVLGGSLVGDSAHAWVFAEAQQRSVPVQLWPADGGVLAGELIADGVEVGSLEGNVLSDTERLNLGGSFDWQLGGGRAIDVFALYGQGTSEHAAGALTGVAVPVQQEGDDLVAGATTTARFGSSVAGQLRVGLVQSRREYGTAVGATTGLGEAALAFVDAGAQIGDPGYPATVDRSEISAHGTVWYRTGEHTVKGGLGARFAQHERTHVYRGTGLYLFRDAAGFADRTGVFHGLEGSAATADFSVSEYFGYVQDRWRVAPGLDLTTGVRYEIETLPSDDILPNGRWRELTGQDNSALDSSTGDAGLVVGFDWDVQEQHLWRVRGAFTIQRGDVPADLLAEALTHDGRLEASVAIGDVMDPVALGPRLTLLEPSFQPATTARASAGVSRALGASAVLHFGAAIRRTENLPRRSDLNQPAAAPYRDQYGRPVLGALESQGPFLVATPNSNRRFAEFDAVSLISSDGTSRYWGVTTGLEKRFGSLKTAAFYTYSSTEDDWYGAAAGAPLGGVAPFGGETELDDWADGTSDFDVPHRVAASAELAVPGLSGLHVGGAWQWSSGRPFTPGFGPGFDANADGIAGNDPAFVDSNVPGVTELLGEWGCLRDQEGRFAERNACRTDDRSLIDAWLSLQLPVGGIRPELRVEALALDAAAAGPVDAALYRLDPDGTVDTDGETGVITVPLAVNPRFGEALVPSSELTRIRISLRMVF